MDTGVLKQPLALFGLPATDRSYQLQVEGYLDHLTDAVVKHAWDPEVLEMVDLLPQILLRLGDRVEITEDLFFLLRQHMHIVLQDLQKSHNPVLEDMISLSSEYTYHFLVWATAPGSSYTVQKPIEIHLRNILREPYWGFQWYHNHPSKSFYMVLLSALMETRDTKPMSAWVWHRMQFGKKPHVEGLAAVQAILPLLQGDPLVCLAVAEAYPEVDRSKLFASAMPANSRRFHYLLLWSRRFPNLMDRRIQIELLQSPAWLVQYLEERKPENMKDLFMTARNRCRNSFLLPWLDNYAARYNWG